MTSSPTAQIAHMVASTDASMLPAAAMRSSARLILDSLGCALGALPISTAQVVVDFAGTRRGTREVASVIGGSPGPDPTSAAYANCYLGSLLDADETLTNSGHVGICSVFPAIALGEARSLTGRDLLCAVAVGYEVGARVSQSLEFFTVLPTGDVHFSKNGGFGYNVFTAAAAASSALGLDESGVAGALGHAALSSPMSALARWSEFPDHRPRTKYAPYADMGSTGVAVALLAEAGLGGDEAVLDGENGYWSVAGSEGCDWSLLDGQRDAWWIESASFKLYSCARPFHSVIDAFRGVQEEHELAVDDIERVHVKAYSVAAAAPYWRSPPAIFIDGQYNVAFALALAAHGRVLDPSWQFGSAVTDAALVEFAGRVTFEHCQDFTDLVLDDLRRFGRSRRQPVEVSVETRSGSTYVKYVDSAIGDPWSAATRLSDDELADKFRRFTRHTLSTRGQDEVIELVFNLESCANVAEITEWLSRERLT